MKAKISRMSFAREVSCSLRDKSPWIIVDDPGLWIECKKRTLIGDLDVILYLHASLGYNYNSKDYLFKIKPIILASDPQRKDWMVLDSPSQLARIYGPSFISGIEKRPTVFLDERNIDKEMLSKLYRKSGEGGVLHPRVSWKNMTGLSDSVGIFMTHIDPVDSSRLSDYRSKVLSVAVNRKFISGDYSLKASIPFMLGSWEANSFMENFGLDFEDIISLEDIAQGDIEDPQEVIKLTGFMSILRLDALFEEGKNREGACDLKIELYWISSSLLRRNGRMFVKDVMRLLAKDGLERERLQGSIWNTSFWKETLNRSIRSMLKRWRAEIRSKRLKEELRVYKGIKRKVTSRSI